MKVLLTCARSDIPMVNEMEPVGLCYLSAFLKRGGHNCRIIHQTYSKSTTDAEIVRFINNDRFALAGFTTYSSNIAHTIALCREIKRSSPVKTVLGGPMATSIPELALQEGIDFVVLGEGEQALLALANTLERGGDLTQVPGLARREGGTLHQNPLPPRLHNLDALPFPDRNDLPWDRYYCSGYTNLSHKKRVVTIISSRGCPFRCQYCATKKMWQNKWIPRSIENVMAEIDAVVVDPTKTVLAFMDQDINVDRERALALYETLGRDPRPFEYGIQTSVLHVDEEMIQTLDRTGCSSLFFGVESGSREVLEGIDRRIDTERTVRIVKTLAKTNIFTVCGYMVGFPDDDRASICATRRIIRRLPADLAFVSMVNPYPGTELHELAERKGWISRRDYLAPPEKVPEPHMPTFHLSRSEVHHEFIRCLAACFLSRTFMSHAFKMAFTRPRRTRMMLLGLLGDIKLAWRIRQYNHDRRTIRRHA